MAKLISLKLLVDKKANKVIFAEAGKDFVDFLFAMLALPAGNMMKMLNDPSLFGCMGNLYESLQNWNTTYFQDGQDKNTLLKSHVPTDVTGFLLPYTEQHNTIRTLYRCDYYNCRNDYKYVTEIKNMRCPKCSNPMNNELTFVDDKNGSNAIPSTSVNEEEGLVKGLVTYMVTDDLSVTPLSMITLVSQLAKFNLQSLESLDTLVVDMDINEAVELLKASLKPKSALTNVFLKSSLK